MLLPLKVSTQFIQFIIQLVNQLVYQPTILPLSFPLKELPTFRFPQLSTEELLHFFIPLLIKLVPLHFNHLLLKGYSILQII